MGLEREGRNTDKSGSFLRRQGRVLVAEFAGND